MDSINNFLSSPFTVPNYFTKDECELIINFSKNEERLVGQAGFSSQSDEVRKSNVRFIDSNDETAWIFKKLHNAVVSANQQYKFDITGIKERVQVAEYKDNGHYTWHIDIGKNEISTRKLSISVQLTDPEEYEGGTLEFSSLDDFTPPKSIGSAIIFPSYLLHRVTPVTSGARKSLVLWVHGPAFR